MRPSAGRSALQRLVQVADQIVCGFEADRQAHDIIASPCRDTLLVGQLPVREARVLHHRLRMKQENELSDAEMLGAVSRNCRKVKDRLPAVFPQVAA